jgi:hypothetical protein
MNAGLPSIKNEAVPWSKAQSDGYLFVISVGVLAGILATYMQTPLHLPGHKAVFWMTPVFASRLLTRRRAGASIGATATLLTTLLLGGRLAGGGVAMPLVIVAGIILDFAAWKTEQRPHRVWQVLLIFAAGGAGANLACSIKRLYEPTGAFFSIATARDLSWAAGCHAFFGLVAAVLGGMIGLGIVRFRGDQRPPALSEAESRHS